MKRNFSKSKFTMIALLGVLIAVCSLYFVSCHNGGGDIYAQDNNFAFNVIDGKDALVYEPKDVEYRYGIIFYVASLVPPQNYAYLGEALAKQGYLVVIPKLSLNLAYANYLGSEPAFKKYPNVKFFIGGHGLGGGAAVRRAQENHNDILGVTLYVPICSSRQIYDKNGQLTYDDDGNVIKEYESIAKFSIPTLLLEADGENIRTNAMATDAKARLNPATTKTVKLPNAGYTGFYQADSATHTSSLTPQQRKTQLNAIINHTLNFLRSVVVG